MGVLHHEHILPPWQQQAPPSAHVEKRQFNHFSGISSGGFAATSGFTSPGIALGIAPIGSGLHYHHHGYRPHNIGFGFGTSAHSLPAKTRAPFPTALPSVVFDKTLAASSGAPFSMPSGGFSHPTGGPHGPHGPQ